jgi:hypothetical protein
MLLAGPPPTAGQPANGPAVGETLGTGPVRVGMILPLTQNGGPSPIGVSMQCGATRSTIPAPVSITLIEDDHSTPDAAAQAAQAELAGAQLILGPVFANNVRVGVGGGEVGGPADDRLFH